MFRRLVNITINMCDIVNGLEGILLTIGVYAFAQYLYDSLRSPAQIVWSLLFPAKEPFSKRYGSWAVITGSSDGIGKEYAKNLAREGMNLMLISRTESKLIRVAEEIHSQYDVEVKWLAVDLSKGEEVYERIQNELSQLEIGILVNNVGIVNNPYPACVEQVDTQQLLSIFFTNMYPTARLVQMLLPEMKLRRRGMVVNVASGAGLLPIPYLTLYASSKAFLMSYTKALQEELRNTGVECQLVAPLLVETNLTEHWRNVSSTRILSIGMENCGQMAVWLIGRTDFTTGHWFHACQVTAQAILPRWLVTKLLAILIRSKNNEVSKQE